MPDTTETTRDEELAYWKKRLGRLDSWDDVPGHTKVAMLKYLVDRTPPGHFLGAVLTNDLMGAVGRADLRNRDAIPAICMVIYSGFPATAWGSEEKVDSWLNG